jgi:hypothetical protein
MEITTDEVIIIALIALVYYGVVPLTMMFWDAVTTWLKTP